MNMSLTTTTHWPASDLFSQF